MRVSIIFYSGLLFMYSLVLIIYVLAGSHGRLLFSNKETLRYLVVASIYSGIASYYISSLRGLGKSHLNYINIVFNLIVIALLYFQIKLLYPPMCTLLSTVVLSLHLLGIILAIIISIKSLQYLYK